MDALTALLVAAATGDRTAFASFVAATQTDVWRFCASLVDPGVADDLVQETYIRAMQSAQRFRGDASARTWLLTIARRVAADEIRDRRRRRRLPKPTEGLEPDHTDRVELHQLLGQLPPDRREAFVLTQLLEFDYAQAAGICDVPVGTIRSRVARARRDLLAMEGLATHLPQDNETLVTPRR